MSSYIKFDCPECGAQLEVWSEETVEWRPGHWGVFEYIHRNLIRHCESCHCDWENEWWTINGTTTESQLQRKFWG